MSLLISSAIVSLLVVAVQAAVGAVVALVLTGLDLWRAFVVRRLMAG